MKKIWLPFVVLLAGCGSPEPANTLDRGAPATFLGGSSVEGIYVQDIAVSMLLARRALRAVDAAITDHEPHADWARIDGRLPDATPVRIRIDRVDDRRLKVTFTAGDGPSEPNKAVAQRLREEYESLGQIHSPTR